jgi:hypothetical protein
MAHLIVTGRTKGYKTKFLTHLAVKKKSNFVNISTITQKLLLIGTKNVNNNNEEAKTNSDTQFTDRFFFICPFLILHSLSPDYINK